MTATVPKKGITAPPPYFSSVGKCSKIFVNMRSSLNVFLTFSLLSINPQNKGFVT